MKIIPFGARTLTYYIRYAYFENEHSSLERIKDFVVKYFCKFYIGEKEEKLIKLVLKDDVSQKDFDEFISDWDIEEKGGDKALLLSYFFKTHPNLEYSEYIEPRLNGLLRYYRFRNLELISHFKKVCSRLKKENIDILIIKGGVMKHYRPEFPRVMGDIDILLRSYEDYERAKVIVEELGYNYNEYAHSIDLHLKNPYAGILDIHHRISMISNYADKITKDLFDRAKTDKVYGIEGIYTPTYEDIVFISLVNLAKNMMQNTSVPSMVHTIFDCIFLTKSKPDFNWNIVWKNVEKTKTYAQIYVAIKFLNNYLPEKLPEKYEKEFEDKCIKVIYNTIFRKRFHKKLKALKKDGGFRNSKNFYRYLKCRIRNSIHKSLIVKRNVILQKMILKKHKVISS